MFDSAPGPGTNLEYLPFLVANKGRLSKPFLYLAYPNVNRVNGMKLGDIFSASVDQAR